jgi:hypothetical protein
MAEGLYTPNPNFYSDQIKEQEKEQKKLREASYDSAKRGYTIDGEFYTVAQYNKAKSDVTAKITSIKKEQRKYGKYGPEFGESTKGNAAGEQYQKLRQAAVDIEVTDYASALENLKAWKTVNDFVEANPDIQVVRNVKALVKDDRGRSTRGSILKTVSIDAGADSKFVQGAVELATRWAEAGTTKLERVQTYGKPGANNAAYKNVKTVTNQEVLDTRLAEIDAIGRTTYNPPAESPSPGVEAPTMARGGQSAMSEEQTMQAFAGLTRKPRAKDEKKPGVPGGGAGGLGGGAGLGGGGDTTLSGGKLPKNWEAKFREMFPQKTWMLDLDRTKYADVFKVFEEGVINEAWLTPEAQQRFSAQLDNTSFIKELASTDMVRQVKGVVGDLGFGEGFNSFLTKAMNFGWKDETLKQEVYKEAFRKDDQGTFVNPTAVTRVKASNDYLTIKKIGTSFFSNIDDDTIQQSLIGGITNQDIERQQRELAKTKYGHLSNLLDQGFTLEKLTSSFRQQAAQLLEKDVNDIDMSQADYEQVINSGEEGKKRMLTTGEWEIKLRSDPRYNWINTQNAKDEARQVAASISQAFGKVM